MPNNVAICMAGDFDPEQVVATIDRYFGAWRPSRKVTYPEFAPVRTLTAPTDTTVVGKEAEQVMLGWKMDGAASLQNDTLNVNTYMLNNGTAGLLDLDVNQPMLCLGAGAGCIDMRDYSQFVMVGQPNEGQTLEAVKDILLAEINKLKRGDFSEKLLSSVKNNLKLNFLRSLDSNSSRANAFVQTFVNGRPWQREVEKFDRINAMTKQQIVDFMNKHFTDGYAIVYKRMGEDTTQKKIDKPQITPIPSNRNLQSAFVKEITESEVTPIQPRFLDYDKDFQRAQTKRKLPVYYIQNKQNELFDLYYRFEFGEESNKWLPYAQEYFDLLGTDKMSAKEVKERFYELGCNYGISVSNSKMYILLSGLGENMKEAMALMENVINHAKADREAYDRFVSTTLKSRKDNKLDQKTNFQALQTYGMYGPYNAFRNVPSSTELEQKDPQQLVDLIASLKNYKHSVIYYGPMELKQLIATIDKGHAVGKKLQDAPAAKYYTK